MPNAIIFGATSGIGKTLAAYLVRDGYHVAITGRRLALLETLKKESPSQYSIYQNDIQDLDQTETVLNEIIADFKTIDLVIHCSGVGFENPDLEWEKEHETIKTNVIGGTRIYNLVFLLFQKQKFGHLVSISSIASLRGNRGAPAYFASKAFQVSYLESLYFKTKEIKGGKVFVTDVRPGYVDTKMALGDNIFWMAPLEKASQQIYSAMKRKKRRVYVSKRWYLMALVLKVVPSWLIKKVM